MEKEYKTIKEIVDNFENIIQNYLGEDAYIRVYNDEMYLYEYIENGYGSFYGMVDPLLTLCYKKRNINVKIKTMINIVYCYVEIIDMINHIINVSNETLNNIKKNLFNVILKIGEVLSSEEYTFNKENIIDNYVSSYKEERQLILNNMEQQLKNIETQIKEIKKSINNPNIKNQFNFI